MRKICLRCGAKFGSQAEYCPHDGSLLARDDELHVPDPLLGSVLLEQFRVDAQIGVGGMGTVYRAHQTTVDRDVAIKVLRAELARDEQAVLRFEREARVCIALDHPNLVRVFLSGRLADGRLYIVMELLEGRSLADELQDHGALSLDRAVLVIMKLCAGLSAVHEAGIVHRDIKPENVFLVPRGRDPDFVKLVDFGVARVFEGDGVAQTTTQTGRVFGTATYISPEAATGDDTDHRSDIYSLGVLSYQLLTGELPFDGTTAGAILMKHVHEQPPPLRSTGRGADVPEGIARVVMRALRKEPAERPQTLGSYLNALAEAAGSAGLLADARGVLLSTVWADELVAPGSYLAELLAGSSPSSLPPALDDTQRVAVGLDPDDEAFLSSAPKPFGTTSYDLTPTPRRKKRRNGWLWAMLGLLAAMMVVAAAGTWLVDEPPTESDSASEVTPEEPIADVGTDAAVNEPEPIVGAAPADETGAAEQGEPDGEVEPVGEVKPVEEAKPVEDRKPSRRLRDDVPAPPNRARTKQATPKAAQTPPARLEPDEEVDWSLPDFPEAPPARERPAAPERPFPTGTSQVSPRNPVVIDAPPE